MMDFEAAFHHVGTFGRFQLTTTSIIVSFNVVFGSQMLLMVIVGAKPDPNVPSEANLTTIVTEWNLYNSAWVIDLIASLFMAGYIAGMVIFGQLPDLYGRKPTVIISLCGILACSFSSAFCMGWKTFAVTRFLAGMCAGVTSPTVYVLMCELVGKAYWGRITLINSMFFPVGTAALALLGYWVLNWRKICIIVSTVPLIMLPLLLFVIPESPRWLYSVGKIEKAEKVLRMMARKNGVDESCISLKHGRSSAEKDLRKYTIVDLCRIKRLLKLLIACCYLWFSCALVYYGLTLNAGDLMPNIYLAVTLTSFVEIPAFVLSMFIVDKKWFGRRGSSLMLLLVCASAMTGLIFVDADSDVMSVSKTVFGLLGKLPIAGAFSLFYLYTSELFPTQLRVVAVGTSSICGRVGAIVAPFVPLLSSVSSFLPYAVFGFAVISSATLLLFLPETLGQEIPKMHHSEKGEDDARNKEYGTFVDCEKDHLLVNETNENASARSKLADC